jgi:hypothetical protein
MSAGMLKKWLWYDLRWWILNPDISWNVEKKTLWYDLRWWILKPDISWNVEKKLLWHDLRSKIQDDHVTEPIQCEANVSLNLACFPSCPVVIFSCQWWSGRLQVQNNVQCSFSVIPLCNAPNCGLEFARAVGVCLRNCDWGSCWMPLFSCIALLVDFYLLCASEQFMKAVCTCAACALLSLFIGERTGRRDVRDALITPICQTSTYFFKDTAELIAFQVIPLSWCCK